MSKRPHATKGSARRGRVVAVVVLCAVIGGCHQYRAVPYDEASPTAVGGSRGVSADGSDTVWPFLWGLAQDRPQITNCQGQGLAELTVRTNVGFTLLTFVTLGFVAPARVEWYCAKPSPTDDTIGAAAAGSIQRGLW